MIQLKINNMDHKAVLTVPADYERVILALWTIGLDRDPEKYTLRQLDAEFTYTTEEESQMVRLIDPRSSLMNALCFLSEMVYPPHPVAERIHKKMAAGGYTSEDDFFVEMEKRKEKKGKRNSVQELLGIRHFTNYGLMTDNGELVFFRVAPTNISVLSSVNIQQKILGLTNLLKAEPDMGIVCTDSCECFDSNREYLRRRAMEESNPKVKALLEMDRDMLTRMQAEMANAREFYLVKRYTGLKPEMVFSQSNTTMKNISDNGFETEWMDKDQIKRLLGIYFGTTMDGDKLPDVDGGQYEQEGKDGTV